MKFVYIVRTRMPTKEINLRGFRAWQKVTIGYFTTPERAEQAIKETLELEPKLDPQDFTTDKILMDELL